MCHSTLAVSRGIRTPRTTEKERRLKKAAPLRDEREVARRKAILEKNANSSKAKAKRARRKRAKAEKAGMKSLRKQGLIH